MHHSSHGHRAHNDIDTNIPFQTDKVHTNRKHINTNPSSLPLFYLSSSPWRRQPRPPRPNLRQPHKRIQSPLKLRQIRRIRIRTPHRRLAFIYRGITRRADLEFCEFVVGYFDGVPGVAVAGCDSLTGLASQHTQGQYTSADIVLQDKGGGKGRGGTCAAIFASGFNSKSLLANLAAPAELFAFPNTCIALLSAICRCAGCSVQCAKYAASSSERFVASGELESGEEVVMRRRSSSRETPRRYSREVVTVSRHCLQYSYGI